MIPTADNTALVLIDVQEKLTSVMHNREEMIENQIKLIKAVQLLEIPIIWLEQNPLKMGNTIPELSNLMQDQAPISKMSFSCCGCSEFMEKLDKLHRKHILIAGIETHVCVYQTAIDLIRAGYAAEVVTDATSSRTPTNKEVALTKINACGMPTSGTGHGNTTTTEIAIFELMRTAEHPCFRQMLKIVK